ncbi:CotY/CotZ family spore coat protein [Bacillus suaedaesalsae]|uniref:Spore coat protein n=1 Tax=Bacillus suaedaesalsae TaxID=2810349 RepID=A0ABS2DIA8_9BACI|nr:CotY/CotZ family spore coat protein [Bacillus suaedaesalsae]MBM6618230.1 spore coat protein [Bacillus suaedaesalsae]
MRGKNCVCSALLELKSQQDQLGGCPTSCFSSLLAKLIKVDTLPFMLFTESNGPLELVGFERKSNGISHFKTSFFRIEDIDEETCCAKISLLRPLDFQGCIVDSICDVARLERTRICTEIDVNCFCAVQCLDVDLLRSIVIEPKW